MCRSTRSSRSALRLAACSGAGALALAVLTGCGGTTLPGAAVTPGETNARPTALPSATPEPTVPTEKVTPVPGPTFSLRSERGEATVRVTDLVWRRQGRGDSGADAQQAWLVLNLDVAVTEGSIFVSPERIRVVGTNMTAAWSGGADGTTPYLPTRDLKAPATTKGHASFDVTPGPVRVEYLGENDAVIGTVDLPGPPPSFLTTSPVPAPEAPAPTTPDPANPNPANPAPAG